MIQVRRLLSGIRNPTHKTCLAVVYACGLRISEATTLEIGAVDRANQVLRIVGKGDKERLVPLPQPVLDALGHLWRRHHNRRWLFPNHRGDAPINRRVLSDTFAAAAAAAGIQRGVTPHALRHYVSFPTMSGAFCSGPIFSAKISTPWPHSFGSLQQSCGTRG
jgi:site-specific recombinase XerD